MKRIFLLILGTLFLNGLYAQTGTIRGQVTDAETGETLIGVTVVIDGTTNGAPTDLDGKYTIANLTPGTYTLRVSYVSYESKVITDIEVVDGQVTIQNVKLGEDTQTLEEIVVTAKAERNSEAAILTLQRKAAVVQDGISYELISRAGDNNAASAIRRVTGVTVEGGKFVYVRGLGDRYSKTVVNSAEIPGLNPDRNAVQMDLFPSNLIDNLIVKKTFSPDLPGNFTGGYVDIQTKDLPDRFTFQVNASVGFNDQATFNGDFLTYEGGNSDWLGFDDGTRELPELIANSRIPLDPSAFLNNPNELDAATRSLNEIVDVQRSAPIMNTSFAVSIGNQLNLFGMPFGIIGGISYNRSYEYYEDAAIGRFFLSSGTAEELTTERDFGVNRGVTQQGNASTAWGAMANFSLKISDRNKIRINTMFNAAGDESAIFQEGGRNEFSSASDPNFGFRTRTLRFTERILAIGQLQGEHLFGGNDIKLEWSGSYSFARQDEPDLRFFSDDFQIQQNGDTLYRISPVAYTRPARFFREMEQYNIDTKVHLTIPFNISGRESKVKIGGSYVYKDRDFTESRYLYLDTQNLINSRYADSNGLPNQYVNGDNIGLQSDGTTFGLGVLNATINRNAYTGTEAITAAYAMVDMKVAPRLRILAGARLEITDIEVVSQDENIDPGILDNTDILPALNLTYELKENMNLRLAYSRTLARPVFREIAPFESFEFVGDYNKAGNPDLERTTIDNLDLRWELYPGPGEIITVSAFYKNFNDPIEFAILSQAQGSNRTIQPRNSPSANAFGFEVEFRKRLDFISESLANFTLGANFSYNFTEVEVDSTELAEDRAVDPNAEDTRRLYAQSPYVVNAFLNYDNFDLGLSANLNFNVFGERLSAIGPEGTPDVFEQPRPTLDFTVAKNIGERWKLRFRARNLINPDYEQVYEYRGVEYIFNSYQIGRTFSLSVKYLID